MNLAGIPPFSGFLGKVGLMQAGIELGTPLAYALVIGGVVTSLLTLLAVARVWNRAFWRKPEDAEHPDPVLLAERRGLRHRPPGGQDQRDAAAADHGGLHAGPGGAWRGADGLRRPAVRGGEPVRRDMLDRSSYIQAVLGEECARSATGPGPEGANEPAANLPAPGTAAAGLARDRLGRPVAGLQPGQPAVRSLAGRRSGAPVLPAAGGAERPVQRPPRRSLRRHVPRPGWWPRASRSCTWPWSAGPR